MFGVEFSHQGDGCTFETLCAVFGIDDPAVARVAEIVHDLDLKDGRFGAATPPRSAPHRRSATCHADDDMLLERGITLFESLYLAFAQAARPTGPRRVAAPKARGARAAAAKARRHRRSS